MAGTVTLAHRLDLYVDLLKDRLQIVAPVIHLLSTSHSITELTKSNGTVV